MTAQNELEISGSFFTHPFAELMTEIMQARLNGSLRASEKDRKWIIYFKSGKVVFAVSNARTTRLFDILLRRNRLTKDEVAKIPNFSNDFELAAHLEQKNLLSKEECDELFAEQIRGIVIDVLSLTGGDWTFSSLARVRDGLSFEVNARQLLIDYARCLLDDTVLGRFRSLQETFTRSDVDTKDLSLNVDEAFILSRAEETALSAADLVSVSAMTEAQALHAIYTLWAGGLLVRKNWRPAFTAMQIAVMKGARLELKREAKRAGVLETEVEETRRSRPEIKGQEKEKEPEITITVEEYLEQVEKADTFYDVLGVDSEAEMDELKRAYFRLARNFHPDRYHVEGGELLARVQKAFTELAQAHETLKNEANREMYDYRMRKEIAEREKHRATGTTRDIKAEQAAEQFERGFGLLMEGDAETALPFLARAAHLAPKIARYRAYYGKGLSADSGQKHKAESEMQAALRIDPDNPTFRILLAEFFIQNNLLKRAEGELNRLLAVFPSNREAQALLDKLKS
jgi:curved DNA-binding protein CbpA